MEPNSDHLDSEKSRQKWKFDKDVFGGACLFFFLIWWVFCAIYMLALIAIHGEQVPLALRAVPAIGQGFAVLAAVVLTTVLGRPPKNEDQ